MNPTAKGSRSYLAFKEETTFGTPPGGTYTVLPITSESLSETISNITPDDIRSDRARSASRGGNMACGGSVTHDFGPFRTQDLVYHLLGGTPTITTPTIATLAPGTFNRGDLTKSTDGKVYICTIGGTLASGDGSSLTVTSGKQTLGGLEFEYLTSTAANVRKKVILGATSLPTAGLSFEKHIVGATVEKIITFSGCRIGGLDISVPQEGNVKATWNIMGLSTTAGDSDQIAGPMVDDAFTGIDSAVLLHGDTDNQTPRPVRDFSVSIDNGIDGSVYVIGNRLRQDLPEGMRSCSGRCSLYFTDSTEYDKFKNEVETSIKLSMIHNGRMVELSFGEVKLTGAATPVIGGSGILSVDFDWTAFKQNAAVDVTATVIYLSTDLS